jgi:predicted metal-dependent HD superfamily phosphohydrolase
VSSDTKDPLSLELALWLHDLIYDTNSADNEERSAEFASYLLNKLTLPQNITKRVKELILATKHDGRESGRESGRETIGSGDTSATDFAYVRDIDLSILGAPPNEYKDYIKAVRKEYAQYSEKQFNEGRVRFLRQFLAKDRIYKTEFFFDRFEDRARDNLFRELKMRSPSDTGASPNQKP